MGFPARNGGNQRIGDIDLDCDGIQMNKWLYALGIRTAKAVAGTLLVHWHFSVEREGQAKLDPDDLPDPQGQAHRDLPDLHQANPDLSIACALLSLGRACKQKENGKG